MLLDRIDIDNHGPLTRVELGPFSEFLNLVCTPDGSGKTALARFVRDSLIRREYPLGMMSSSAGRVVWADRNGKIHCRREHDGTPSGRRTIEFESRGDGTHRFDWLHGSWIDGIADSTDASRALESIRIPESIVDGIVTDTAVTSVSRVIQAALSSGLADPSLYTGLPASRSTVSDMSPEGHNDNDAVRRGLRDELARIDAELASYSAHDPSRSHAGVAAGYPVESRRAWLRSRLAHLESIRSSRTTYVSNFAPPTPPTAMDCGPESEWVALHDRIWHLRVRQSELTRWLDHLQSDRRRVRYTAPITASPYAGGVNLPASNGLIRTYAAAHGIDASLRERLTDIDSQIIRWRRVLAEIAGLQRLIVDGRARGVADPMFPHAGQLPLSDPMLRRHRMDHVLYSLDHYVSHPSGGSIYDAFTAGVAASPWPYDLDLRIESIVRQVDSLATHYDRQGNSVSWYRDLPSGVAYRGAASLVHSLRSIRDDLEVVRRQGFRFNASIAPATERTADLHRIADLQAVERWAVATIERLLAHRDGLVRDRDLAERVRYPFWLDESYYRQSWSGWYIDHLDREVASRSQELECTKMELERCLQRASQIRPLIRSFASFGGDAIQSGGSAPVAYPGEAAAIDSEMEAFRFELQSLDRPGVVASVESPRLFWLQQRRVELIEKLGVPSVSPRTSNPLADESSQWLVRLSGGRLRRVDWDARDFTTATKQVVAARKSGFARIDGLEEASCPAVDRALAALAVRLAAGDLLARTGRAVPVVVETHRELMSGPPQASTQIELMSQYSGAAYPTVNLAVVAALDDYAKGGRQVVVLASDSVFAEQVSRRGGKVFYLQRERIEAEHRPLWRPHFADEQYVGPHAGSHLAPAGQDPLPQTDAFVDRYYDEYFDQLPVGASLADINRNLDAIWQEAYGISPHAAPMPADFASPNAATYSVLNPSGGYGYGGTPYDARPDFGVHIETGSLHSAPARGHSGRTEWSDGYYVADTYTTAAARDASSHRVGSFAENGSDGVRTEGKREPSVESKETSRKRSPFYLSVDSPIDQAPSIDAVAASRLRRLNVTHINHLMNQDPNRLADSLGLAGVTAATIRRWQSECRLVCHVPQLRGFDAKVLVGCGIVDAGHLASTDPIDLLDRVEAFLATERGQRILLSGTSYELSRITSWIATANVNTDEISLSGSRDGRTLDGRVIRHSRTSQADAGRLDNDQYEYEFVDDNGDVVRAVSNRSRLRSSGRERSSRERSSRGTSKRSSRSSTRNGRNRDSGSGRARRVRPTAGPFGSSGRDTVRGGDSSRGGRRQQSSLRSGQRTRVRTTERSERSDSSRRRSEYERSEGMASESRARHTTETAETELKFYLQRQSPIVDAPSIGARMAEKLEAVGVYTVDDLLNFDASELAEQLDHRRIDSEVITAWQNQAILVCRIPMLRGHDAQLLVAAEVSTPEDVASYDAETLFGLIDPIARSNEGKRIIRGGKLPDLDEISEWIYYAGYSRELVAA